MVTNMAVCQRGKRRRIYAFDVINVAVMLIITVIMVYPMLYVLSMSLSSVESVQTNKVYLFPIGLQIESYKMVLNSRDILTYLFNSVFYAVVGSLMHVCFTMLAAYPLTFENFCLRKAVNILILITMFFGGGLIPFFILIKDLHLYGTRWAILLPGLTSAWSIIIARIYIKDTLGKDLINAARIDGCNDFSILIRIVMPLSLPIIAYLGLTSAVGHWNSYFNALLFLPDKNMQPIQIFLMRTIIENTRDFSKPPTPGELDMRQYLLQIKYAVIILATAPILVIYPFLQKYFVKGIMVGALIIRCPKKGY